MVHTWIHNRVAGILVPFISWCTTTGQYNIPMIVTIDTKNPQCIEITSFLHIRHYFCGFTGSYP